jgi:hypothetical protein
MPRNLRLLQIDDDLRGRRLASKFIDTVSVGNGAKHGIDDWDASIEFWSEYERSWPIDLITADIRFTADGTTPLLYDTTFQALDSAEQFDELLIPTGLSHVKPFAAIARAAGQPVGIAVHTADVGGWKTRLKSKNVAARVMAYLAAHEIGELVAILGDRLNLATKSNDERLEACWRWLGDRTYGTFDEAWPLALQSYRESLVRGAFTAPSLDFGKQRSSGGVREGRIVVLPSDWARMASWCERMGAQREAILVDDDPGFSFVLPDGSRESIFFRSLFADAHMSLKSDLDFEIEPIPSECFRAESCENSFKLNEAGHPLIGPFLMEFRDLKDAYELAVAALDEFPVSRRAATKLGEVLSLTRCGELVYLSRFLAVLFQIIRRDCDLVYSWESAYQLQVWDVVSGCFVSETLDGGAPTLRALVEQVYGCATKFDDGFTSEELMKLYNANLRNNERPKVSQRSIECCIGILVSWSRIIYREEDSLYDVCNCPPPSPGAVPPVPLVLPDGILEEGDVRAQEIGPFLRDVFGYGGPRPNDNQIGRFVAEALGLEVKAGRDFLAEFVNGVAPGWIKELCRTYAADRLQWRPTDTWPRILR